VEYFAMKTAIVNLGKIITGDWRDPITQGDTIIMDEGVILSVGTASTVDVSICDVVIDADGSTAIPGFIDSQIHNTFGDYTPRQKTVGFL
jgi:enamidase